MSEEKRVPTTKEAHECLSRFIHSHFNRTDKEQARFSVPCRSDHDDDMLLHSFIKDYDRLTTERDELKKIVDRLPKTRDGVRVVPGDDRVFILFGMM